MQPRCSGPPRALLLDALGTLVALEPPAPRLRTALARAGVSVTEAQATAAIGAEIAYYRAHLDEGRDRATLDALRARCAHVLRAALPDTPELAALDGAAMTDTLLAALHFTAFPEVVEVLRELRGRGVRLVVVSNWDVSLHDVLARVGLAPLLDGIITSAEAGSRKPDPTIFVRGLALAGVGASDAVHVGDSPGEDVAGARAAGIEPVLVWRERSRPPMADVTVAADLSELRGLWP